MFALRGVVHDLHRPGVREVARGQVRTRQQQGRVAVLDHEGVAFTGVGRIQREECAAGLPDRQQAHCAVYAAVEAYADDVLRSEPAVLQPIGERVGAPIQLSERESPVRGIDSHIVGPGGDLIENQVVNATR
ncbi:hypothetical protein A4R44_06462 [Amycolatopsis sp. M39]|nr:MULTISPECIES: hypothetical protein [Amycolatopsis]OAP23000.1 hypothetical protein A4R44_06462 [Amycolatopsis sp. M39]